MQQDVEAAGDGWPGLPQMRVGAAGKATGGVGFSGIGQGRQACQEHVGNRGDQGGHVVRRSRALVVGYRSHRRPPSAIPKWALASSLIRSGDRKSVVSGKSVSVRVDLGGSRIIKKKKQHKLRQMNIITKTIS